MSHQAIKTKKKNIYPEILEITAPAIHTADLKTGVQLPKITAENFDAADKPLTIPGAREVMVNKTKKALGFVPKGADNQLPFVVKEMVESIPVPSACLKLLEDLTFGKGLKYGYLQKNELTNAKELVEDDSNEEINTFLTENDIDIQLLNTIIDIQWFKQGFYEILLSAETRKIVAINSLEYLFTCFEEMNPVTGVIENIFYYSKWNEGAPKDETVFERIPLLDKKNPTRDLLVRLGRLPNALTKKTKDDGVCRYAVCVELPTPGHPYYPKPEYYSFIKSGWGDFAKKVLAYKTALLDNQITIKYHIEFPHDYFDKIFKKEGLTNKEKQEARIEEEYKNLDDSLSGTLNTGKSIKTFYRTTPEGKETDRIKITVLDNKFKGGEYAEDSSEAARQIYTAFGVPPSLIGTVPGKGDSNISGSDKRELLLIQQARTFKPRQAALKPFDLIKTINNWDSKIKFFIPDLYTA